MISQAVQGQSLLCGRTPFSHNPYTAIAQTEAYTVLCSNYLKLIPTPH